MSEQLTLRTPEEHQEWVGLQDDNKRVNLNIANKHFGVDSREAEEQRAIARQHALEHQDLLEAEARADMAKQAEK